MASFEGAGSGVPTNEVWARRVYDQSEKMKQEKKDLEDKFKLMEEKQKLFEAMLKNFHGQPVSFKEEETPQEKSEPQKDEEGQDEQARCQRAEGRFGAFVAIHLINDEQDHRGLVEVVVEGIEQLRDEQRQETPRTQQIGTGIHVPPGHSLVSPPV